MPKTAIERLFFMFLTVLISVTAFTIYNTAIHMGKMSNKVFLIACREIPIEFIIAFLLEALFIGKLAEKLAFRMINPAEEKPVVIILAITAMTICLMCPAMSFVATILYNGINLNFFANWFQKIVYNFPFAFFTEIFFIGPAVRLVFRNLFRRDNAAA